MNWSAIKEPLGWKYWTFDPVTPSDAAVSVSVLRYPPSYDSEDVPPMELGVTELRRSSLVSKAKVDLPSLSEADKVVPLALTVWLTPSAAPSPIINDVNAE